jgi:hypothetical protein
MSRPRYALCEEPTALPDARIHIRQVGQEGIAKHGSRVSTRALCGKIVGWDLGPIEGVTLSNPNKVCPGCARRFREIRIS